ncbi:MAG: hypothetical protein R3Y24_05370 [Eubacteriales bacterium]
MKNNNCVIKMNCGGELIQKDFDNDTKNKYKVDSLFMWGPIPCLLMIVCIGIDIAFFYSLFVRISYDAPIMIVFEVAGLAFAADFVAVYAGILSKEIKQGLSKERLNLCLLLGIPALALIINGILRATTMSIVSVNGTIDAATIALTIIAIVTPVFTSIGNFAISYQAYDPLGKRMCREEMAIDELRDFCRRLEAIQQECNDFNGEKLMERDKIHFENAKKECINDGLIRINNVEMKLMEHLGDPTTTNLLSQSNFTEIISRLKNELTGLQELSVSEDSHQVTDEENIVNFAETA